MNFKTVLKNAISHHYDLHKEVISEMGVSVMLWSESNPKTQYEMMRVAKTKTVEQLDLKSSKVSILEDLFPDTPTIVWRRDLKNRYQSLYGDIDQVKNNLDLIRLWSLLCDGRLDSNLINKYLV